MTSEDKPNFDSAIKRLVDPSQQLATKQMPGLSAITADEASALRAVWPSLDRVRRRRVVYDLAQLAEDDVELDFDSVFLIALADSEADVRREAVHGLSEHEGRELIGPLLLLLEQDPDAGVRADAALALGRFVLQAEFQTLPGSDAERIENTLRRTFNDPTEPVEVRARAIESIGARSEDWASVLIEEAFDSDDRRMRISAVHAMGRSADPAWLSSVIAQLDSDDAEMRFEAATAAGSIADQEAAQYLVPLLHDEDVEVRMATIMALGEIGGDEAKDALKELAANGDSRLAEAVAEAIAEIEFAEDPLAFDL